GTSADGRAHSLNALWTRRVNMKSNGPPYVIQRAAAAVYTPDGAKQVRALIDFYMANARVMGDGLAAAGVTVHRGRNAPDMRIRLRLHPGCSEVLRAGRIIRWRSQKGARPPTSRGRTPPASRSR